MFNHFSQMTYKQVFYSNTKLLVVYFTQYLGELAEEK